MNTKEFKAAVTKAMNYYFSTIDRERFTVNELIHILMHHNEFSSRDYSIAIKRSDNYWTNIQSLEDFINLDVRGVWFNPNEIEYECKEKNGMFYNNITLYETK